MFLTADDLLVMVRKHFPGLLLGEDVVLLKCLHAWETLTPAVFDHNPFYPCDIQIPLSQQDK